MPRTRHNAARFHRRNVRCKPAPVFEVWVVVAAVVLVFAGGVLQGSIGFGFAVLSAPLLALIDQTFVPIAVQFAALPLSIAASARERTHADFAGVGWIILGRLPGTIVAALVLTVAVERTLDILIGTIVLGAVVVFATGAHIPMTVRTRVAAGFASGFSGTASAIGGPPLALLYGRQRGPTVRSTLGTIFAIGLVINLTVLAIAGLVGSDDLWAAAIIVPPALAGFLVSSKVKHLADGDALRRGILAVAAVAALGLLARALLGG